MDDNKKLTLLETLELVAKGELLVGEAHFIIASDITNRISNAYMQGYDDGRIGLDDLFGEDE